MNGIELVGLLGGILIGLYTFYALLRISKLILKEYKLWAIILCLIPAGLFGYSCSNMWGKYFLIMIFIVIFSLIANLVYVIYLLIIKGTKKNKSYFIYKMHVFMVLPLLATIGMVTFGIINMNNVVETNYSYNTIKTNNKYKIALISDTHYDTIQNTKYVDDAVNKLNTYNIDLLILDGDIVDENTSKESMIEVFNKFGKTKTKYGIYYVYGNHDRQTYKKTTYYTIDELENAITSSGIIMLKDEYKIINNDLLLIGRKDKSLRNRKDIKSIIGDTKISDYYTIVADHQPVEFEENSKLGVDLELSGHTHAGQIWPLGLIIKLFQNKYVYGEYKIDNSYLVVSSGFTGWGYPIRTEKHCEYVIVNIN